GKADRQLVLHEGFGVRVAFRGHDLHGLTLGLDGRIYFSIGDRGYHVETKSETFANPESGAVFRCEQDGSHLEVFATGFRNPQELAFNDYGDLFTGDNNSDSGDLARWVHVWEGGDAGWRMAFQYLADRGPWNQELLWKPSFAGQAAWIMPPVENLGDGPSGICYYPGTGLSDSYLGNFFMCDFRGQANQSGVRTFKVRSKGASFELFDQEV
ncbi:MAG: PQQ-dependent sugar dehydrogenase, partial [Planctomycetales bacterium]|nr:PQQ-dependent sugar dehydrogenase [Planctomycetales bacterium]